MKYKFNDLFDESDGTLMPKKTIKLKSVTLSPSITFKKGVSFSGIDIFDFKDMDIEAEDVGGTLVIKGFYKHGQ
ncbi:MAG: hypothetical protein WC788_03140 [Candidatus Paceibacterota bacterium]|jgi:hypothetical protein